MLNIDYDRQNEEVRRLLQAEREGRPERVRMSIACNPRMILSDPALNQEQVTFQEYIEDPEKMLAVQCRFQEYFSDEIISDREMGFQNLESIPVYPDTQNVLEAAYFGCPIAYHGFNEPGTRICLTEENKRAFLDQEYPSIFTGLSGKTLEYMDCFAQQKKKGYTYHGKPIGAIGPAGTGTDGPFTIACCLLGATELCIALYEEEDFARALLSYITEGAIQRIRVLRRHLGEPERSKEFFFADDSIAMLSEQDYRRFVLPLHKRIIQELAVEGSRNQIHLCGNASHLFPAIQQELNVYTFDTGFPVRHGRLVQELAPGTVILGGVHVDLLLNGDAEAIRAETRRILEEVKPHTRSFIIKEANNLSPGTRPESLLAMHEAVRQYGRYENPMTP